MMQERNHEGLPCRDGAGRGQGGNAAISRKGTDVQLDGHAMQEEGARCAGYGITRKILCQILY